MSTLLEQFLSESRDVLQEIGTNLVQLESDPASSGRLNELFRLVHTLKGNSGLFTFPEMTRVLHAGEDLMDAIRNGRINYSQALADCLLDAMDFVSLMLDEIERTSGVNPVHADSSNRLAQQLRALIAEKSVQSTDTSPPDNSPPAIPKPVRTTAGPDGQASYLASMAEDVRVALFRHAVGGGKLWEIVYRPEEECFFKGEDPFFQVRQIPEIYWSRISTEDEWPPLNELDAYRCKLVFQVLTTADEELLRELFRYVPEQVQLASIDPISLVFPEGRRDGTPLDRNVLEQALQLLDQGDLAGLERIAKDEMDLLPVNEWPWSALRWVLLTVELAPDNRESLAALLESMRPDDSCAPQTTLTTGLSAVEARSFQAIIETQRNILALPNDVPWAQGRIKSVASTLGACFSSIGRWVEHGKIEDLLNTVLKTGQVAPLLSWLDRQEQPDSNPQPTATVVPIPGVQPGAVPPEEDVKFGRRAEDHYTGPKTLKVEQAKIDRLMSLIGEMVVAKNSLPYLASRAESQFGVRELSREIKTQYAVINRISEEMQDAIMQVRMMPVAFIFQRFPRLVRDISRKLGKQVNLVLEGEDTEADKNIIEALADPLIHIIRNSLDHGIEQPEVRTALGKPAEGRLAIRARQESDRVVIEITDDGRGIDSESIKHKAYEKGLIDAAMLERLSDHEAVNLVFAPGFSTAETVSDVSGRGVGMDVVRTAIERVNGNLTLSSEKDRGTRIQLSLPLSVAVTHVMIVETDGQIFGIPIDMVLETVRVGQSAIHTIKRHHTTVLRGKIVPLVALNDLLALGKPQRTDENGEIATMLVRFNGEPVGIMVDDFHQTTDIILKPLTGVLGTLSEYSGSALLGDGSVLMVLNLKELL